MDIILLMFAVVGLCTFAAGKSVPARIGGIVAFLFFGAGWTMTALAVVIPPGSAGVVFNRSVGWKRVLPSGLQIIVPFFEVVYPHDVRTQNMTLENEEAVSADQQVVHTNICVNFHPLQSELSKLYLEVGFDYNDKIVVPVVREALKAEIAKLPVDQTLLHREQVSQSIREYVAKKLAEKHLVMEMISLTNVKFSQQYQDAVEQKQVALQQAEAKRNEWQKDKSRSSVLQMTNMPMLKLTKSQPRKKLSRGAQTMCDWKRSGNSY